MEVLSQQGQAPAPQPSGMRPSYSYNSLAAAEQLEALMRDATAPNGRGTRGAGAPEHSLFSSRLSGNQDRRSIPSNVSSNSQQQLYVPQSSNSFSNIPFGCNCSQSGSQNDSRWAAVHNAPDRMEAASAALPMLLHGAANDSACIRSVLNEAPAQLNSSLHQHLPLSSSFGHQQLANSVRHHLTNGLAQQLSAGSSPMSLLYAGAAALGPTAAQMQQNSMSGHGDQNEPHQKRRFVWTPDLHARFEAACNQLGLDNAKPKSILRLMNVEGLTKANIKSHLQKYRCMVQKRDAANTASDPSDMPLDMDNDLDASDANGDGHGISASALLAGHSDGAQLPSNFDELPEEPGETFLLRNLKAQEEMLLAQMQLQEQLSKQLVVQQRLQAEMESMMQAPSAGESHTSATSKINEILSLRNKLQGDLQAHQRMQHELFLQLNQVVLPAIGMDGEQQSENAPSAAETSDADDEGEGGSHDKAGAPDDAQHADTSSDGKPNGTCNRAKRELAAHGERQLGLQIGHQSGGAHQIEDFLAKRRKLGEDLGLEG